MIPTKFKKNKKILITCGTILISLAISFCMATLTHKKYQSIALVRLGHYPCYPNVNEATKPPYLICDIENTATIKARLFLNKITPAITRDLKKKGYLDSEINETLNSLKILDIKSDQSTLQITAYSNQKYLSTDYLKLLTQDLIHNHALFLQPLIENYKAQLQFINDTVLKNNKDTASLKTTQFTISRYLNFEIKETEIVGEITSTEKLFSNYLEIFLEIGLVIGYLLSIPLAKRYD
ncbi:hypothetical protein [Bdellovibrio sp. HCB-162]|uniref:hypothetical protein n=1 Tax=Bdellovibrio sp. HCB-162 TaxID=3394234 RepID=UPI0039BC4A70